MRGRQRRRLSWVLALAGVAVGVLVWFGGQRFATAARERREVLQAVAIGNAGDLWIGGSGGLVHLMAGGERARVELADSVRGLLVDPGNPSQLYALGSKNHIWRTQDGGRTWAMVRGHGLPAADVRALAYDPSGPTRLVALVQGQGYFQSDLAGEMWMQVGAEDIPDATAMVIHPLDARTVLVGTPAGLYRSTNQGMRFDPVPVKNAWDLPGPVTALAVAGDRSVVVAATGRGLYRSADGGRVWFPMAESGLPDAVAVAVAPWRSHEVVVGSRTGALAMSRDGGKHWQRMK